MPEATITTTTEPSSAPAVAAPAPTQAAAPWFKGKLDDEHVGVLQNRQWQDKPVEEVAVNALKAYRELEKLKGVPADQLLRFKPDDQGVMQTVYDKLGVPRDGKEYDFSGIKFSDGTELEPAFTDKMRAAGLKWHVPKETMKGIVSDLVSTMDEAEKGDVTINAGKVEAGRAALRVSWGENMSANTFVARQAAVAMGFDKDIIETLETTAGYEKVMQALLTVGKRLGEDKYVSNGQGIHGTNTGVMTVEQATAEKARLTADKEWARRAQTDKNSAEWQQLMAINRMIASRQG